MMCGVYVVADMWDVLVCGVYVVTGMWDMLVCVGDVVSVCWVGGVFCGDADAWIDEDRVWDWGDLCGEVYVLGEGVGCQRSTSGDEGDAGGSVDNDCDIHCDGCDIFECVYG